MASDQTPSVPAGWYPDPYGISDMRWWDSQNWTDSVHPPVAAAPDIPAPEPVTAPEPVIEPDPEPEPIAAREPAATPEPMFAPAVVATPTHFATPAPLATPASQEQSLPALAPPHPNSLLTDDLLGVPTTTAQTAHESAPILAESASAPQAAAPAAERAPVPLASILAEPTPADVPPAAIPLVEPPAEVPAKPLLDHTSDIPPLENPPSTGSEEPVASTPRRLPSRREMRLRNELESGKAATASVSSNAGADQTSDVDSSSDLAAQAPVMSAPTQGSAVPDSATPTAFDWLSGPTAGGTSSASSMPPPTTAASTPSGVSKKAASAHVTPLPSSQDSHTGFPPLGTPAQSTPISSAGIIDVSGAQAPAADTWARESRVGTMPVEDVRSTATRMATVSSWFIAFMPLLGGILSVSAVKGQENYPRYIPEIIQWWMLVGAVIVVLYFVTLILAVSDRRKLDWAGYNQPAHWAWAFLGAPVYLLVRTLAVKRETGRNSVLLIVWLVLTAALVGAWFAADYFMPELIAGYTLPFL